MARGIKGHEWTAAEDAVIREMLEGGSSVIDVCDRLGVDMVTMKNRLYALRKADPTFPRCMRGMALSPAARELSQRESLKGETSASEDKPLPVGEVSHEGVTERASSDACKGELGELERVLADQLAEVTSERDELAHKVGELTVVQVRLLADLSNARKDLEERDGEVRELARQLAEARAEVDALIEEKECYTEEFEDGVAYYKRQASEAEAAVSAQIDVAEAARTESRRLAAEVCEVNRIVVGLVAGYVLNHTEEVGG